MGLRLRKYGWSVLLFVGLPFLALLVRAVYYAALDSGLVSHESTLLSAGLGGVTTTLVLGIFHRLVRKVDQATLRLAWTCTLVVAAIRTLVFYSAVLADYPVYQSFWTMPLIGLLELFPLVWFARQASRHSLAHAFFLLFIVGGLTLPNLSGSLPFHLRWLWGPAAGVPAAWLVVNFDLRGPAFRRWSVIVIAAVEGLTVLRTWTELPTLVSNASGALLVWAFLYLIPFALVYFVRVQQPAAKAPPTPPREEH